MSFYLLVEVIEPNKEEEDQNGHKDETLLLRASPASFFFSSIDSSLYWRFVKIGFGYIASAMFAISGDSVLDCR
jgi:hypothetical protein